MKSRAGTLGVLLCIMGATESLNAQWMPTDVLNGGPITAFASTGGTLFVGTSAGGVYRSSNHGATWTQVNNGLENHAVLSLSVMGNTLCAATNGGGVFLSSDGGERWTVSYDGLSDMIVQSLAVVGEDLFAGTMGGLSVSVDDGVSWDNAGEGLTGTPVRVLDVTGDIIIAGTNGDGVYVSTNSGTSWSQASAGLTNTSMFSLTHIGPHLFAGTYGGMFTATSPGMPWSPIDLSATIPVRVAPSGTLMEHVSPTGRLMKPKTVYSLTALNNQLYVGTYGAGVFQSTDLGVTWSQFNGGLGNLTIYVLRVIGKVLYAGTFDGEVWWRPLEAVAGVQEGGVGGKMVPALFQNYPNPCNLSTTIHYDLERPAAVQLTVYSLTGRLVTALVNEKQQAGSHEIRFDATSLASGTYFYRLVSEEFAETKRLLLVK